MKNVNYIIKKQYKLISIKINKIFIQLNFVN